jgi:cell division protein ZapA (FtsZ GTPase activity inhibitor)
VKFKVAKTKSVESRQQRSKRDNNIRTFVLLHIMETLIPVNILIGDRNYRIKVSPEDEEHVRKTVKTINEKIIEFKTNFAGKDMQVAMVLIWYATQITSGQNGSASNEAFLKALQKLEEQVTELLPQEKENTGQ